MPSTRLSKRRTPGGGEIESIEQLWARRRVADQRRQIRRLATITALVLLTAGGGYLWLSQRPPILAAVHTALPPANSAVTLSGLSQPPLVRAQLHKLVLEAGKPDEGWEAEIVELLIPVRASACARLVEALGGACGALARPARPIQPPMIFDWPAGATLTATAREPRRLQLSPAATEAPRRSLSGWTMSIGAEKVRLSVDCFAASSLVLIPTGASAPISIQCVENRPTRWRLPIVLGATGSTLNYNLLDLASIRARADASTARLGVDNGLLRLGDSFRKLEGDPLKIDSERGDAVSLDLEVNQAPERTKLSLETPAAKTVEIAKDESVPTRYSRHEELWLPVIFAVIGVLATAWFDRLLLFR